MRLKSLLVMTGLLVGLMGTSARGDLIITAVVDTPSGSHPRVLEVQAQNAIADTSAFFFIRQSNGSGTITDTQFSSFSLAAGEFAYVTTGGASTTFLDDNSFGPILASVSTWNGDDILGISTSAEVLADASDDAADLVNMVDSFGLFGQADTDFYADGVATRQSTSVSGTGNGLFDASNFDFVSVSSASGAEAAAIASFGQFTAVPETSTIALAAIGAIGGVIQLRRRKAAKG